MLNNSHPVANVFWFQHYSMSSHLSHPPRQSEDSRAVSLSIHLSAKSENFRQTSYPSLRAAGLPLYWCIRTGTANDFAEKKQQQHIVGKRSEKHR